MIIKAKIKNPSNLKHIVVSIETSSMDEVYEALKGLGSVLDKQSFDALEIVPVRKPKFGCKWYALELPNLKALSSMGLTVLKLKGGRIDTSIGNTLLTIKVTENKGLA
jgi:hypothetical protein